MAQPPVWCLLRLAHPVRRVDLQVIRCRALTKMVTGLDGMAQPPVWCLHRLVRRHQLAQWMNLHLVRWHVLMQMVMGGAGNNLPADQIWVGPAGYSSIGCNGFICSAAKKYMGINKGRI